MLLLLGCAIDGDLEPVRKDEAPDDTGTPTGDTDTDTGPAEEPCTAPGSLHALETGPGVSPYATILTADLDGGGQPDLLYESWRESGRGIALVRGEDLSRGDATANTWFVAWAPTAQASLGVGFAGDLDEDGKAEFVVAHGNERGGSLAVWSTTASDAPLATIVVDDRPDTTSISVSQTVGPDLDGDGIPEVLATVHSPDTGDGRTLLFGGAMLGAGGAFRESDSLVAVGASERLFGGPVADADLDGDGLRDMLLVHGLPTVTEILLLPAELAARGGLLDAADLDVLLSFQGGARAPLLVDLDDDGLVELFEMNALETSSVHGFAGGELAEAARAGRTLEVGDAAVTLTDEDEAYLGFNIAPITDGDCATGLALSAALVNEVRLVSNASLRAGGTVVTEDGPILRGGSGFGYALGGGRDLDGDGTLDLVAAAYRDRAALYLAPWDAAR